MTLLKIKNISEDSEKIEEKKVQTITDENIKKQIQLQLKLLVS